MNKLFSGLVCGIIAFGLVGSSYGAIIDFTDGLAYLNDGQVVTTDNISTYYNVNWYEEDGFKIDFIGGDGIIGNYEGDDNSVIHVHWGPSTYAIVFTKLDGTTMDLNYIEESSNTIIPGGLASGNELTYLTGSNGVQVLLPPSDWGLSYTSSGELGDGAERLYFGSDFDAITSFTITSTDAYCFGMDNFYIDEKAPDPVPEPVATSMIVIGLLGLLSSRVIGKRKV